MDDVYPPNKFICSDFIEPIKFLEETSNFFPFPKEINTCLLEDDKKRVAEIKILMGIDLEDEPFKKLLDYCSTDSLRFPEAIPLAQRISKGENLMGISARKAYEPITITPEAFKLKTITKLKERLKTKTKRESIGKYTGDMCPINEPYDSLLPKDLVPGNEVLIKIRLYHPFRHELGMRPNGNPKFHHDITVLGSQTLETLRDKIVCPNDLNLRYDLSENVDFEDDILAKEVFKSGFLFITNTFYNDMRDPNNVDYSETIRDWAKKRKDFGSFEVGVMEKTTFKQLKIRFGYPQVYMHQGNCEHLFVFSDMEVLQPSDNCSTLAYPMLRSVIIRKGSYCNTCGMYLSKWYVTGSERIPFDPSFYCDTCFRQYHYKNGKKLGSFKAYPFFDKINAI